MRRKCVLAPFHDLMSDLVGQLCLSPPTAFVEKTQPPTTPLFPAMMAAPEYSDEARAVRLWDGSEPLSGNSIAMRFDKTGLGEWSFGARYYRTLEELGADALMEVPTKFRALAFNWPKHFHEGEPAPETDFEISAMFIPAALRTTLATIPPCPYITADPARVAHWRERLGPGPHVAMSWTGGVSPDARRVRSLSEPTSPRSLRCPASAS
jgi:hypothetical protein